MSHMRTRGEIPRRPERSKGSRPERKRRGRTRREIIFWAKRGAELLPALAILAGGAYFLRGELNRREQQNLEARF
jgi:hypothetical protein